MKPKEITVIPPMTDRKDHKKHRCADHRTISEKFQAHSILQKNMKCTNSSPTKKLADIIEK